MTPPSTGTTDPRLSASRSSATHKEGNGFYRAYPSEEWGDSTFEDPYSWVHDRIRNFVGETAQDGQTFGDYSYYVRLSTDFQYAPAELADSFVERVVQPAVELARSSPKTWQKSTDENDESLEFRIIFVEYESRSVQESLANHEAKRQSALCDMPNPEDIAHHITALAETAGLSDEQVRQIESIILGAGKKRETDELDQPQGDITAEKAWQHYNLEMKEFQARQCEVAVDANARLSRIRPFLGIILGKEAPSTPEGKSELAKDLNSMLKAANKVFRYPNRKASYKLAAVPSSKTGYLALEATKRVPGERLKLYISQNEDPDTEPEKVDPRKIEITHSPARIAGLDNASGFMERS